MAREAADCSSFYEKERKIGGGALSYGNFAPQCLIWCSQVYYEYIYYYYVTLCNTNTFVVDSCSIYLWWDFCCIIFIVTENLKWYSGKLGDFFFASWLALKCHFFAAVCLLSNETKSEVILMLLQSAKLHYFALEVNCFWGKIKILKNLCLLQQNWMICNLEMLDILAN